MWPGVWYNKAMKNLILSAILPIAAFAAIQYVPAFRPVYNWMNQNEVATLCIVFLCDLPFAILLIRKINLSAKGA
jgi:hypothetical protein